MFYEDRCQFFEDRCHFLFYSLSAVLEGGSDRLFQNLLFTQFFTTSFCLTRIFLVACVNRKTRQATSKFKKLSRVN